MLCKKINKKDLNKTYNKRIQKKIYFTHGAKQKILLNLHPFYLHLYLHIF